MTEIIKLNDKWKFFDASDPADKAEGFTVVDLPHTWNAFDGSDGGNDYLRCKRKYEKVFSAPAADRAFIRFKGVNSSAEVFLNGEKILSHDGGYSAFGCEMTDRLKGGENTLVVFADNSPNETVYPQTADFTFFGGIYRDVELILKSADCFDPFFYDGGSKIEPKLTPDGWVVSVSARVLGSGEAEVSVFDGDTPVAQGGLGENIVIPSPHLWNGVDDPFLYRAKIVLKKGGKVVDEMIDDFGLRTFFVDPDKGFILNGKPYPLHGVSRHQDRKGLGNAITEKEHIQDLDIIAETGANALRLAHYQHDDTVYEYCDKLGLVVWAEVPYISRHMPKAHANVVSQAEELVMQQFNRPCVCFWGVSNEITMFRVKRKDMLARHRELNELFHRLDPSRLTTLACYAMCSPFDKSAFVTDVVGWNLYLGWYTPFLWLNDLWIWFFRVFHRKRAISYSEYGAEGMPQLHSLRPRRGDNTEEYQLKYHEFMLKFFERHPYLWGTFVWNAFDFAADARDQGGEPGMNHKGLVTYDRKIRKDAFYLYKAYWSKEPFVYICGRRFINRTGKTCRVKVYSNLDTVALYNNGKLMEEKKGNRIFEFSFPMQSINEITAVSGDLSDGICVRNVDRADPDYSLKKGSSHGTVSWEK